MSLGRASCPSLARAHTPAHRRRDEPTCTAVRVPANRTHLLQYGCVRARVWDADTRSAEATPFPRDLLTSRVHQKIVLWIT